MPKETERLFIILIHFIVLPVVQVLSTIHHLCLKSILFLYFSRDPLRTRIIHSPFCESFAVLSAGSNWAGSLVLNKHISQAIYQTLKTTKVNFEKLSLTSFQIRLIPKQNTAFSKHRKNSSVLYDFFKIHRKIWTTVQVPENTKHLRVKCKSNSRFYVLISSWQATSILR